MLDLEGVLEASVSVVWPRFCIFHPGWVSLSFMANTDCCLFAEELLSLLGSGLGGVGDEELEDALGRAREEGGGRESRVGLYDIGDPLLQVS